MRLKTLTWKQETKNQIVPLVMDFLCKNLKKTFIRKIGFPYRFYKKIDDRSYSVYETNKEFEEKLRKRCNKDKKFLHKIFKQQYKDAKLLKDTAIRISRINHTNSSNEEIINHFKEVAFAMGNASYAQFMSLPRAPLLEGIIRKQLEKRINNKQKVDKYFRVLVNSKKESNTGNAQKELLKIASSEVSKEKVKEYVEKYGFLNVKFGYGETYSYEDIIKRIEFLKKEYPQKKLELIKKEEELLKEEEKRIVKELNFDKEFIDIIELAKENAYFRTFGLENYSYAGWILTDFYKEICERVGLSYEELFHLRIYEIIDLLEKRILIKERKKLFAYLYLDGETRIVTGEEVEKWVEKEELDQTKWFFKGTVASKGNVEGTAKIIKNKDDLPKVLPRDILVAEFTTPDFIPAMEKASAIISDLGGLTSHTAVVSRELGKPCIVGLGDASKIIKDDDLIKIDTDKGTVTRKLNLEKLSTGDYKVTLTMTLFMNGFVKEQKKVIGYGHDNMIVIFNDARTRFYMSPKELIEVGNLVISKLEENPNYANEIIAQHLAVGEELLSTCRNIHNQNLKKKSKKELCKLLINYFKTFEKFSGYHILPVSLEKQMAKKVREYLERKTSDVNDKLIALSTPIKETDNTREKRDLLKIVIYAKKNNSPAEDKQILELLKKHKEKHEWMAVAHKYTPYPLEHYISELKKELSKNPEEELEKLNNRPDEVEEERNKILSELNLPKNIKLIIDTLREFTFMRDFKRNTGYRSHYYMQNMWLEIGRRAKISVEEVKFCTPNELIEFLLGKKKLNKEISHERKKYHIIVVLNGKMKLLMGKEAKEFEKAQIGEEKVEKVDSLKGMPACKGYAKGRVKIVLKPEEITKVEKGDILVAVNTEPAMVPAMERAAAIVTDEGGITCHAAIVSREMGKPCVIGTKVATQVLKDGDMVEVDAEKGIIRKIS